MPSLHSLLWPVEARFQRRRLSFSSLRVCPRQEFPGERLKKKDDVSGSGHFPVVAFASCSLSALFTPPFRPSHSQVMNVSLSLPVPAQPARSPDPASTDAQTLEPLRPSGQNLTGCTIYTCKSRSRRSQFYEQEEGSLIKDARKQYKK
jgi:hypothetical protein